MTPAAVSDVKAGSFTRGASDFIMPAQGGRTIRTFFEVFSCENFQAGVLVLQGGCAKYAGIPLGAECNYPEHHRIENSLTETATSCFPTLRKKKQEYQVQ